jgi:uncharacterized repeat protein (TIGR02543 family)
MAKGIRSGGGVGKAKVTYYVDTGVSYMEEVPYKQTVLSPTTFTPTKTGYVFRGWREDNQPVSDVLTDMVAKGKKLFLYAVFERAITVTYYNLSTAASSVTNYEYYNNSNLSNPPEFRLIQNNYSGWTARGWTTSSSGGSSAITYQNDTTFTRTSNITLYGCYQKTVTVTYNANSGTGTTANSTGTAYHHSTSGATNATIALRACGYSKTNYIFANWRLNNPNGTAYAAGSNYASTADATMYAYWVIPVIISNGQLTSDGASLISASAIVTNDKYSPYGQMAETTPPGTYGTGTVDNASYLNGDGEDSNPIYGHCSMMAPYHWEELAFKGSDTISITFNQSLAGRTCNIYYFMFISCRYLDSGSFVVRNGSTEIARISLSGLGGSSRKRGSLSFTIQSGQALTLQLAGEGHTESWSCTFWVGLRSMALS